MTLIYTATGEKWRGERIGDIAHPRNIEQLWTTEQLAALGLSKAPPPTPAPIDLVAAVNQERDRRIAAGVTFGGKVYQSDSTSKQRLLGVALQATLAIMNGAQANNMRWADPDIDFTYISADNTAVVMDAPTVIALGQTVAGHEKSMIYKARALKDRDGGPPADYANDSYWT